MHDLNIGVAINQADVAACPMQIPLGSNKRPDTNSPELARVFDLVGRYFALLSDPTRLKILHFSCHTERAVSDIMDATGATQTNVSRHLSLLYQAGLVCRRRDGKRVLYSTRDPDLVKTCCHACAHMVHKIKSEGALRDDWVEEIQNTALPPIDASFADA
ncbi:MAG: metalloregulator ArsR/SmtB family transcription factor [Burkholderiales bacterium]|jgi:DNA-binding transcriptional ArsR family regulator|nr:metalloregulator ArsR/SmtB family transcription factor [Burkholderiales bacterium]